MIEVNDMDIIDDFTYTLIYLGLIEDNDSAIEIDHMLEEYFNVRR